MKKLISIFFAFMCTSIYTSDINDPRWPSYLPKTPRICQQKGTFDSGYEFDTTYRKKLGNQYMRDAIEDKKQEAEAVYKAYLTRLQAQQTIQETSTIKIPTPPKIPVTPMKTPASFPHLRTPKNATEIQDLICIKSMLPLIIKAPQITQFDIQPSGTYSYPK